MFEIWWDKMRPLLCLRLRGFWSDETAAQYEKGIDEALSTQPARFSLLVDLDNQPLQSPDTVERHHRILVRIARRGLDRIAVVGATTLLRHQVKRAVGDIPTGFFPSEPEARTWLEQDSFRGPN